MNELLCWIVSMGLSGVFVASFLEKFVPVIPSYLMLMLVGMAANSYQTLFFIWGVSVAGSVLGTVSWYKIGHRLGNERVSTAIEKYGKFVFLSLPTYQRLVRSFRSNDFLVILFAQAVPVARIYLALPAGVIEIKFVRFLIACSLGISSYNIIFLLAGFHFRFFNQEPVILGVGVTVLLIISELIILFALKMKSRFLKDTGDLY
ncbi:alkaline phosphatase [Xanthomonas arboricola]|uniref:DedA family protein n=1 Tax=Xanthomonas arboricola TaxID=56448 RepID=UPI00141B9DB5|nr:VTT domain-containing protein [Xanthomonas arboricola]NIJ84920.1 alkaline phosphatase [Xanthomonas arboricola]